MVRGVTTFLWLGGLGCGAMGCAQAEQTRYVRHVTTVVESHTDDADRTVDTARANAAPGRSLSRPGAVARTPASLGNDSVPHTSAAAVDPPR